MSETDKDLKVRQLIEELRPVVQAMTSGEAGKFEELLNAYEKLLDDHKLHRQRAWNSYNRQEQRIIEHNQRAVNAEGHLAFLLPYFSVGCVDEDENLYGLCIDEEKLKARTVQSPTDCSVTDVINWTLEYERSEGETPVEKFIVIFQSAVTTNGKSSVRYSSDCVEFDTRDDAISHGFKARGSDDFNIGVLDTTDTLVSFDWMDQPLQHDLAQVARHLGIDH